MILGEVIGVDKDEKRVFVNDADRQESRLPTRLSHSGDRATHSYFGHSEFEKYAPALKSLADAAALPSNPEILGVVRSAMIIAKSPRVRFATPIQALSH